MTDQDLPAEEQESIPLEIINVDTFMNAIMQDVLSFPGSTVDRPVWIHHEGWLYRPAAISRDEAGGIVIDFADIPSMVFNQDNPMKPRGTEI